VPGTALLLAQTPGPVEDRALVEMIRRWQKLPIERRTSFLRKRVGAGRTAL
jgi:hypothetical protein